MHKPLWAAKPPPHGKAWPPAGALWHAQRGVSAAARAPAAPPPCPLAGHSAQ